MRGWIKKWNTDYTEITDNNGFDAASRHGQCTSVFQIVIKEISM